MEENVVVTKEKLMTIAEDIIDVVMKKNHDYGDAWQRYGIFTPLIRINDKLLRIKTLSLGEKALVADESILDTIKDIVAYGLLALLKLTDKPVATQPKLPMAWTDEEGIIHAIIHADEEVHDKKIYEDELLWYTEPDGKIYTDIPINANVGRFMCREEFNWHTDDNGRHFIFQTDLDIKWENDKTIGA
jgi:hypothetical protein